MSTKVKVTIGCCSGWVLCGILATGILFAYVCAEFPLEGCDRDDFSKSVFVGLFGPLGLIVALFVTGFARHGWRVCS